MLGERSVNNSVLVGDLWHSLFIYGDRTARGYAGGRIVANGDWAMIEEHKSDSNVRICIQ